MQELIEKGIKQNLISFDENQEYITYKHQNKKRKYSNPEEKVQALTFLKLVLEYKYPVEQIKQFEPVKMGSSTKEADIIVFSDKECLIPYIIVECKKSDISDLEFKNAIEQAFSYAITELASFVWITSGLKDEYFIVPKEKPRKRTSIPDIPFYGSKEILEYKFVAGGQKDGKKFRDLEQIQQSELTQVFKQAHNALWGGGELNPSAAFDELDKLIFCKIWDERNTDDGEPYKFQIYTRLVNGEQIKDEIINEELAERINELYENGRKKDPEVFKENIRLSPSKIRSVVGYLEKINLSKTDLDSKGRAFETFMGSFFRGDFGQYFTPREIVKFVVDVLPITNESLVLDTSCGSGGFLLHALDKVRKLADKKYPNLNSRDKILKHHSFWHDFAEKNLYGIEINEQIARVAKMNMIIHDDGHTNVIAHDGLAPITKQIIDSTDDKLTIEQKERYNQNTISNINEGFKERHFDFIITNPPFGSIIKQTEKAYLHQYNFGMSESSWLDLKPYRKGRENQSTEILFIEQAHNFLKPNGILAIVIPDGILTNSSLQYVRDSIEELYRIIGVISMPQTTFSHTGAGVKSSVLFLQKYSKKHTEKIQNAKLKIQDKIKTECLYLEKIDEIEKAKKEEIKKLDNSFTNKEDKKSQNYKDAKKAISDDYKEKIDKLKRELTEKYQEAKAKIFQEDNLDYDIFMAIADNIGYDATGKPTGINELDDIAESFREFMRENEIFA